MRYNLKYVFTKFRSSIWYSLRKESRIQARTTLPGPFLWSLLEKTSIKMTLVCCKDVIYEGNALKKKLLATNY